MQRLPFHRRVLPWLFVLIFLFIAPAVVFYTAGYRWNSKKGVIEKNGTLIIDSMPRGAKIFLNGQMLSDVTPVTLQNTAPGIYNIKLSLDGYHDWSKELSVEPERVTFATNVLLWPDKQPELVTDSKVQTIFADADHQKLLIGIGNSEFIDQIDILDAKTGKTTASHALPEKIKPAYTDWDTTGNKFLIYGTASDTQAVWLLQIKPFSIDRLPDGIYHWDNSLLTGISDGHKIEYAQNGSVIRLSKDADVFDILKEYFLKNIGGTNGLVLLKGAQANEGFVLPAGNWQFRFVLRDSLVLQDNERWLWIDLTQSPYSSVQAAGEWLQPLTIKHNTTYLIKNLNEIYTWKKNTEPLLVYRQSDPIAAVSWQADGYDILVASSQDIFMLNLDSRNGYNKTQLAHFDKITNASIYEDTVFITGTLGGKQGLWKLALTASYSTIPQLNYLQ